MNVELAISASRSEYLAALRRNQVRVLTGAGIAGTASIFNIAFWVAGGILIATLAQVSGALPQASVLWLGGAAAAMFLIVLVGQTLLSHRVFSHLATEYAVRLEGSSLTLDDAGARQRWLGGQVELPWRALVGADDAGGAITLHYGSGDFILIPDRAFESAPERAAILTDIRSRLGSRDDATRTTELNDRSFRRAPEAAPVTATGDSRNRARVLRNIAASLRALAFLRTSDGDWQIGWGQLLALLGLSALLPLIVDFVRIGPGGEFSAYALPGLLFSIPLLLVSAWAVSAQGARSQRTLELLVAFSGMLLVVDLVYLATYYVIVDLLAIRYSRNLGMFVYYAPYAWVTIACAVHAIRRLGLAIHLRAATVLTLAALLGLPLALIQRDRSVWTERYDSQASERDLAENQGAADENAFYAQSDLLEQALDGIASDRKGIVDLYFVGAAGYSRQDVFLKEVRYVERLFAERFDTGGRSILLVNNRRTALEYPIASGTALRRALKRIGERMNPDEDILFLFLTSHGSQDHKFSLEFWPLSLLDFTPKDLKEALDSAGIKKRVIIVSACYAGGFIDPLKDADSMIIAAAAPDRNSFGCSNEADLTYFGKAYFAESLSKTLSFAQAFELALPAIAAREQAEGHPPSAPQIYVGENIRPALDKLVARLPPIAPRDAP